MRTPASPPRRPAPRAVRRPPSPLVYTYDDLLDLPEDDHFHYELHDGELVVTPAPIPLHQAVSANLGFLLETHIRAHGLGVLYFAPLDVVLDPTNVLQPDILFIARARRAAIVGEKNITGPPDLVVEILSKGTAQRDRVRKRELYRRFLVRHVWILDPFARALEENVLRGRRYARRPARAAGAPFRPACFPGLAIDLGAVWA